MTPSTKKIVIWSSVAVVLSVGGYFLYQYIKKQAEEKRLKKEEEEAKKLLESQNSNNLNENPNPTENVKEEPSDQDPKVLSDSLTRAINLIISKGYGNKAKRDYLTKTNPEWVKKWAWAIDNDKKAFTWQSKTWRTRTGEKLLEYNPIGVQMTAKPQGATAYKWASSKSGKFQVNGNREVGKVRSITFDGQNVWFYLPDVLLDYKWGMEKDFNRKTTK